MNKTVYSQLDSRWAKLPYPNSIYTLSSSGCGCVSVTHLLIETTKYKKWTPADVQPYMKQFAIPAQGTTHAGIKTALTHYGFTATEHGTMAKLFDALKDRKYKMGILLFTRGTKGGITWTTGGHYVAFVDYKVTNGKHYFYTKDSGGRKHTGWYCYETQMKGLVYKVWSAVPSNTITATTTYKIAFKARGGKGTMKTITVEYGDKVKLPKNLFERKDFKFVGWSVGKSNVVNMEHFQIGKVKYKNKAEVKNLAKPGKTVTLYACWKGCGPEAAALWLRKIAADNKFAYGMPTNQKEKHWAKGRDRAHQTGCHFCGTTRTGAKKAKAGSRWDYTYCCNALVIAAYTHGANMWSKCPSSSTKPEPWLKKTKKGKKIFKKIGKNVEVSKLKPGDILLSGTHAKMFVGVIKDKPREGHAAREGWDDKSIRVNVMKSKTTGKFTVIRMK